MADVFFSEPEQIRHFYKDLPPIIQEAVAGPQQVTVRIQAQGAVEVLRRRRLRPGEGDAHQRTQQQHPNRRTQSPRSEARPAWRWKGGNHKSGRWLDVETWD